MRDYCSTSPCCCGASASSTAGLRPACSCRTARTGSVCLGLVRLGPQTQWPTFISCRLRFEPPSPHSATTTVGSISNKYWSGGFSYLLVKPAAFYCPDFFSLSLLGPPPALCLSFSSAALPLAVLFLLLFLLFTPVYQQMLNLFSIKTLRRPQFVVRSLSITAWTRRTQAVDLAALRSLSEAELKNATSGEVAFQIKAWRTRCGPKFTNVLLIWIAN